MKQTATCGLRLCYTRSIVGLIRLRRLRDNALPPNARSPYGQILHEPRDGTEEHLDREGIRFESLAALRKAVARKVRALMSGDMYHGLIDLRCRIDAEDADGVIVYTLPFKHAVDIVPDTSGNDQ